MTIEISYSSPSILSLDQSLKSDTLDVQRGIQVRVFLKGTSIQAGDQLTAEINVLKPADGEVPPPKPWPDVQTSVTASDIEAGFIIVSIEDAKRFLQYLDGATVGVRYFTKTPNDEYRYSEDIKFVYNKV
ncbi:hypothetical protein [Pseudomonas sp. PS02290]|uniref:hypothetical protein n=1 Tax=Pseudomonas sp. PS02290 TaxID=2991430 RepID=UPI00249AE5BF|nr:hypothetical protein [Pseudomonas sp. PS02290]